MAAIDNRRIYSEMIYFLQNLILSVLFIYNHQTTLTSELIGLGIFEPKEAPTIVYAFLKINDTKCDIESAKAMKTTVTSNDEILVTII